MATFTQQKLTWRACDQAFLGEELWKEMEDNLKPLGERAQCALMRAPLDYANPASGELHVALSRVAAERPEQRLGAIFFNPGGPGADGLMTAFEFATDFRERDPADPVSQPFKQMSNRYDLIGFSPRGTGAGTQLECRVLPPGGGEGSIDNPSPQRSKLKNVVDLEVQFVQACIDNPLSKHIHTDAMARDMDLMRGLLGYEKLNYIGASYGTILGAWYASLFPERVGRMLFDSSDILSVDDVDAEQIQYMVKQRLLEEVFLPYATRHHQLFGLGESVAELRSKLAGLSPELRYLLFIDQDDMAFQWSEAGIFEDNLAYINAALGLQSLLAQQPTADEAQIDAAVLLHRFAPDVRINSTAVRRARRLVAKLFAAPDDYSAVKIPSKVAVYLSVISNDIRACSTGTASSSKAQDWINPLAEALGNLDFTWPMSGIQAPPLAAAQKAGPLLMLHSRYDALTPIEGAQKLLHALPNARMIVVENESRHGIFPYGDQCVDAQVANYFLHGTMPQRLSCAGKPLESYGDEEHEDEDD